MREVNGIVELQVIFSLMMEYLFEALTWLLRLHIPVIIVLV